MRLIDETPRTGIRSSRVAFLHPAASGGVLTEIVEPAEVHALSDPSVARAAQSGSRAARSSSLRVPEAELDEAAHARCARAASGWHEVEAADGAVLVDLGQVVYLRVESDEHRVGF